MVVDGLLKALSQISGVDGRHWEEQRCLIRGCVGGRWRHQAVQNSLARLHVCLSEDMSILYTQRDRDLTALVSRLKISFVRQPASSLVVTGSVPDIYNR